MRLPVEVMGLIAEHAAQHIIQASPFIHPTNEEEAIKAQKDYCDLLNLVVSCKVVYNNTRHLLYTCLALENATDIVVALVEIVKYPHIGPSIRYLRCSTELYSETERDMALQYWLSNHTQDTALLQGTLKAEGLRPPWWNETDIPWPWWEGFVYDDCAEVALLAFLYLASELESFSFLPRSPDVIIESSELRGLRGCFEQARNGSKPLLSNLRSLQIRTKSWNLMDKWLPADPYENLQIVVFDGMNVEFLAYWCRFKGFQGTHIKELYLGTRSNLRRPVSDPYFARREWVKGKWTVEGPKELELQSEILQRDNGRLEDGDRGRAESLRSFRDLRVLDVIVDNPPSYQYRNLIVLKNIASASLEVFRIEGYPFPVDPGCRGLFSTEHEPAFSSTSYNIN
ncbi:hypothetical protein F53441_35 [Fusarium austroafricanum]|uniref:Uncharacterized protein n=1 Tax=Fusarium austroafricanum TaxID=2364996 RepID=A0A8H4KYZ6_9HYPO|nr:hypothetical protein F53441_35 [Fusarium austroafricanum]